ASYFDVTEYMRVATDELVADPREDIDQSERAFSLGDRRVEDNVKQNVTKFSGQVVAIAPVDCVDDFKGFLEKQVFNRVVGLLAIPRTVPSQVANDSDEVGPRLDAILGFGKGRVIHIARGHRRQVVDIRGIGIGKRVRPSSVLRAVPYSRHWPGLDRLLP